QNSTSQCGVPIGIFPRIFTVFFKKKAPFRLGKGPLRTGKNRFKPIQKELVGSGGFLRLLRLLATLLHGLFSLRGFSVSSVGSAGGSFGGVFFTRRSTMIIRVNHRHQSQTKQHRNQASYFLHRILHIGMS
ncbi:MAG: hypothetical protein AB7P04_10390, partial [Bacteriovoracia bacterium]